MRRLKKAQVSLEVSLAFVAVLLFLLGMIRIWFWGNRDLYQRQSNYIATRSATQGIWPMHTTADFSDDIVFRGQF